MKPNKAVLSRFRVTGTGKILRRKPGRRHLLAGKAANRKRRLRKDALLAEGFVKTYKRLMGV